MPKPGERRTNVYLPHHLMERLLAFIARTGRPVNVSAITQAALTAYLDAYEQAEGVPHDPTGEELATDDGATGQGTRQ